MKCFAFAVVLCAVFVPVAHGAVEKGENLLLNGALEADQVEWPSGWRRSRVEALTYQASGGPNGRGCVSFFSKSKDAIGDEIGTWQTGYILVPGGKYKISALVRTRGFSGKQGAVAVVNEQSGAHAGLLKLPSDTDGKWVLVEKVFSPPGKEDSSYTVVAKAECFTGALDVTDIKLEAVDDVALAETKRLAILAAQYDLRVLPFSPLLGRIPRHTPEVEFRAFGTLPQRMLAQDCEVTLERDGCKTVSRTPLMMKGGMKLSVPCASSVTQGWLTVAIVKRGDGKKLFSERWRYRIRDVPQNLNEGKKLNNLCYELVRSPYPQRSPNAVYRFDMSRDGWVFIKAGLVGDVTVKLDGGKTVIDPSTPRGETFRYLEEGRHFIEVSGSVSQLADVVVRRIAEIFDYSPCSGCRVAEYGAYDWDFCERYVFPAMTMANSGGIKGDRFKEFRERGYRRLGSIGTVGVTADKLVKKLTGAEWFAKSGYDGLTCDEQNFALAKDTYEFASGLSAYEKKRKPNHSIYAWVYGKPSAPGIDEMFFANCVNIGLGGGRVLYESYCRTWPSEKEAVDFFKTRLVDSIARYRAIYPISPASTGVILGNFNLAPIISIHHHPEVDFKRHLDLQVRMLATDPVFDGIGIVGYWGCGMTDEEIHRWSFALMRHYVVEGRTDSLSDRLGFKYLPNHILNGDFRGTMEPWRSEGGAKVGNIKNFVKTCQNRWGGTIEDYFAIMPRGENSVATLKQTAKNLVPGRMYRLKYITFDVKDVRAKRFNPRKFGITASVGNGAIVDPALTWTHVDRREKGMYAHNNNCARVNLGQMVFTATKPETEIVFSNEAAVPGEELGINYISLHPYYPAQ